MRVAVLALLLAVPLRAAFLRDVPQTVVQPDGTVLHLLATGDEYYNRLHDQQGFTVVRDPASGWLVYATKANGGLAPTVLVVGQDDPRSLGLVPNLLPDPSTLPSPEATYPPPPGMRVRTLGAQNAPEYSHIQNLVVFIRFSDESEFTTPVPSYDAWLNTTATGAPSMRRYFQQVSYGQLDIQSTYYPLPSGASIVSFQDSHPRSYYKPYDATTNPGGYQAADRPMREHVLLAAAVNAIASQVPTGLDLDNNHDGFVDNVCFVVSGQAVNADWSNLLWPHRWNMLAGYPEVVSINGKQVGDYNLELDGNLGGSSVFCHEMTHTLGAPDLYRYPTCASDLTVDPVGSWDLMDQNLNPPQHTGAYLKYYYLGFIPQIPTITSSGVYQLNPLTSSTNNCYRIPSPDSSSDYFVVEYRRGPATSDPGYPFDTSVPGTGLLVYRIDGDSAGQGNACGPPDEVYIYRPGGTSTVNGAINLAAYSSQAGRTAINDTTDPSSFLSNGSAGGLNISEVGTAGATISFRVTVVPPGVSPTAKFTWSPTNPGIGQSVQFTDTSTGLPTTWAWAFGDGGSSQQQNPTHVYASPGTYTVQLTASNSSGSNQVSQALTVAACPYAISPSSQDFSASGGNGTITVTRLASSAVMMPPESITLASAHQGVGSVAEQSAGSVGSAREAAGACGSSARSDGGTSEGTRQSPPSSSAPDVPQPEEAIAGCAKAVETSVVVAATAGLLDHTMAKTVSTTDCTRPVAVSSFSTSDTAAYSWSYYSQVAVGDQVRWEWYKPDGSLYTTGSSSSPYAGNVCFPGGIYIAGHTPATLPGSWSVKVYYNGTLVVTEPFSITGSATLVDHTMAKTVSTTDCTRPVAVSSFSVTDAAAYSWSYYSQVTVGDQVRWEWYKPDGSLYTTSSTSSTYAGNVCFKSGIYIAGYPPATLLGLWSVKVYYNGALVVTEIFQIVPNVVLLDHTMAKSVPSSDCTRPLAVSSFSPSDATAYSWSYYSQGAIGDQLHWEWYRPDGSLYLTSSFTSTSAGLVCFWDEIYIAGHAPATLPGLWSVKVYYNGALVVTEIFQIVPNVVLLDHTMAKSVPSSDCTRPLAVSSFSPSDATAYSWSYYSQGAIGDQLHWEWYRPDGSLYTSSSFTSIYAGNGCFWGGIYIAGHEPATEPGAWSVKVYYNTQQMFTESFTITPSVASCPWVATSAASWVTITSGASGSGDGTVSFTVSVDSGAARTGTITVAGQTFTVNQSSVVCTAPSIATQPQSQSINSGQTATLSVAATGAAPLSYQWYQGDVDDTSTPVGTNLSSFTTPTLTSTTSYWVRVFNACGHEDSDIATITVHRAVRRHLHRVT